MKNQNGFYQLNTVIRDFIQVSYNYNDVITVFLNFRIVIPSSIFTYANINHCTMKTSKKLETELTESGINSRLNHKAFLEHSAKSPFTKAKKLVRSADKSNQGILLMLGLEDYTAQSKITLHPEFVAFAFHLYGLSRKLFIYILFHEVNNDTCAFAIDASMIQRFSEFCSLFGEDIESEHAIHQATRNLIRKNIMTALTEEEYMLNPLIAGGSNENKRRKLIDAYTQLLEKKGFDTSVDFYPRYQPIL